MPNLTLRSTNRIHRVAYDSRNDEDSTRGTVGYRHLIVLHCGPSWHTPLDFRDPKPGDVRCLRCYRG